MRQSLRAKYIGRPTKLVGVSEDFIGIPVFLQTWDVTCTTKDHSLWLRTPVGESYKTIVQEKGVLKRINGRMIPRAPPSTQEALQSSAEQMIFSWDPDFL